MPLDIGLVDVVEAAFVALAGGKVIMPPILSMDLAEVHGEVDVKTAYIPGLESFALKVSTGFFNNAKLGLPSLGGLMTVFSATTGQVQAVLLDNGFLTDMRTAAAGAVAARHLAPRRGHDCRSDRHGPAGAAADARRPSGAPFRAGAGLGPGSQESGALRLGSRRSAGSRGRGGERSARLW